MRWFAKTLYRCAKATCGAATRPLPSGFRLAEISESEMQALLAYVDDSEDEDDSLAAEMEAAGIVLHVYDGLEAETTDDEDDEPTWQPDQPR